MFDFAWSEIALIGVVALVLIGPKDLPVAIKAVAGMVRKARKMAGEFQTHVDEMTKDTGIAEVRQQIAEIRNMDIRGEIERAVDADGSIRKTFADDPFKTPAPPIPESVVSGPAHHTIARPEEAPPTAAEPQAAPAFIPPPQPAAADAPPAFIPPGFIPPGAARSPAAGAGSHDTHQDAASL